MEPFCGDSISKELKSYRKKAVRIITHSYTLAHTSNLFKQLKILTIQDIFNLKQLIFYHKFINNNLPICLKNILTTQNRTLRSCHTAYFLKPPDMSNTEAGKQCIRHSIPKYINSYTEKTYKEFILELPSLSILSQKTKFKGKNPKLLSPKMRIRKLLSLLQQVFQPIWICIST